MALRRWARRTACPAAARRPLSKNAASSTSDDDGISLDEAVRSAEAQYRARVVRTEVQDEDGRKVYVSEAAVGRRTRDHGAYRCRHRKDALMRAWSSKTKRTLREGLRDQLVKQGFTVDDRRRW
jgi:hypothetical protein